MPRAIRLLCAALLGGLAAVLVACGSSGTGLIPAANAGPLLSDFQAVERAAREGDGNCAATEAAIRTTEHHLRVLPASIDAGLHARIQEGVSRLRELALEACAQPLSQTTATGASTSTVPSTPSSTATTPGSSTAPTSTTPETTPPTSTGAAPGSTQTPGSEGGGTAPGAGGSEGPVGESPAREGAGGESPDNGAANGGTGSGGTGPAGGSGDNGSGQ